MGIIEDVDAIYADHRQTPEQKRQNAAVAKAVAWRSALLGVGVLPQTWTYDADGSTWEIIVTSVTVSGGNVSLDGVAKKNGMEMRHNSAGTALWPIVFGNPPLLMQDSAGAVARGGRSYRLDIVALARTLIARAVNGALP